MLRVTSVTDREEKAVVDLTIMGIKYVVGGALIGAVCGAGLTAIRTVTG